MFAGAGGAGRGVECSSKGLDCLAGSVLRSPWAETLEETPHSSLMIPCMSHSFSNHQNLLAVRLGMRENNRPCLHGAHGLARERRMHNTSLSTQKSLGEALEPDLG